jgi:hypothetical protein
MNIVHISDVGAPNKAPIVGNKVSTVVAPLYSMLCSAFKLLRINECDIAVDTTPTSRTRSTVHPFYDTEVALSMVGVECVIDHVVIDDRSPCCGDLE